MELGEIEWEDVPIIHRAYTRRKAKLQSSEHGLQDLQENQDIRVVTYSPIRLLRHVLRTSGKEVLFEFGEQLSDAHV